MIQDLGKRMQVQIEKIQEIFNKDLEELQNKKNRDEHTIPEIKNTLEVTEIEERTSDLEDRMVEITAREQNKEKRIKRNEECKRCLGQH